jgi:plastocyanin
MTRVLALLLALGVALAAAPGLAGEVVVRVGHNRIEPAEVTVKAGDTVRFVNEDEMPGGHSLVADDGSFASPPLGKGEDWSHTFAEPGRHGYAIKEHPSAKGTVVVE